VPVAYVTLRAGSTVSGDELRRWAAELVPEPAAAPKSVSVIDTIPMTAVGKTYKLPLRADATRAEIQAALADRPGIDEVDATVDDGTVGVAVSLGPSADVESVRAMLDRYAIAYDIKVR
jgi:fatty-acyl-CoA synthase